MYYENISLASEANNEYKISYDINYTINVYCHTLYCIVVMGRMSYFWHPRMQMYMQIQKFWHPQIRIQIFEITTARMRIQISWDCIIVRQLNKFVTSIEPLGCECVRYELWGGVSLLVYIYIISWISISIIMLILLVYLDFINNDLNWYRYTNTYHSLYRI